MKRFLSCLCVIGMLCSIVSGCGGGGAPSSSQPAQESTGGGSAPASQEAAGDSGTEEVTLRYMWWGSQTRHDHNIEMVGMYMDQNPHVTVEYEYGGFDTYWDKASAMASASNLPDVWQNSVAYILSYMDKGQLVDMNPYIQSGIIDLSDWEDVFINLGVIDGGNYGLTLGNSAYSVIYDPDAFDEAGIPQPTLDWTWDDYLSAIRTITENTDMYGDCQFPGSIIEGYQQYLRQHGYIGVVNAARDGLEYKKTDLWIEFFTLMKEQLDAGYVVPFDQAVTMQAIEQTGVATGLSGIMGVVNSNQAVAAANARGKDLALTMFPHMPGETQPGTFVGPTMFLSMAKNTVSEEESAKLIHFLLNDVDANKLCLMEKGVPASAAVREAVEPLLNETARRASEYVGEVAGRVVDYDNIYPVAYSEMNDLYNRLVQDMMFGRVSIEDAGQQFITEADAILATGAAS